MGTIFDIEFRGDVVVDGCDKENLQELLPKAIWKKYKHYGDYYTPNDFKQELSLEQIQYLTEISGVTSVEIKYTDTLVINYSY